METQTFLVMYGIYQKKKTLNFHSQTYKEDFTSFRFVLKHFMAFSSKPRMFFFTWETSPTTGDNNRVAG